MSYLDKQGWNKREKWFTLSSENYWFFFRINGPEWLLNLKLGSVSFAIDKHKPVYWYTFSVNSDVSYFFFSVWPLLVAWEKPYRP